LPVYDYNDVVGRAKGENPDDLGELLPAGRIFARGGFSLLGNTRLAVWV
jgi:hypothetical protein